MKGKAAEYAAKSASATIRRCGSKVVLHKGGKRYEYSAYIQPDVNRNRRYLQEDYTPAGRADTSRYLYRGPAQGAGLRLAEGDIISCVAGSFRVVAVYDYYIGERPIYRSGWLEAVVQGVE